MDNSHVWDMNKSRFWDMNKSHFWDNNKRQFEDMQQGQIHGDYGWAEAVMQKPPISMKSNMWPMDWPTDQQNDRRIDGQTDEPTSLSGFSVACLKTAPARGLEAQLWNIQKSKIRKFDIEWNQFDFKSM